MHRQTLIPIAFLIFFSSMLPADSVPGAKPVRVGILGFDNYQALAFTQLFHKPPEDNPDLAGLQVVSAWPGGSPDLAETMTDIERWRPHLIKQGITIVDSIDEVLKQSNVVMIMTVDGRAHLQLAKHALRAKKPVYIGRPMAASLDDVIEMFQLAEQHKTPLFSCSQHRYSPGFIGMRDHPEVGKVQGCDVYGGCPMVEHHPDLFWHAVHSIETLYTIMGPGAVFRGTGSYDGHRAGHRHLERRTHRHLPRNSQRRRRL